jgi:hypothetical protein
MNFNVLIFWTICSGVISFVSWIIVLSCVESGVPYGKPVGVAIIFGMLFLIFGTMWAAHT